MPTSSCRQALALLGPNGAGKSTTFNMLLGLLPATAGSARVLGHNVTRPAGATRARPLTGLCPQFDVLWDRLTAGAGAGRDPV
jgi:ABC-type multidrug transport system ATPase subunit